jgi:hypothetical protein
MNLVPSGAISVVAGGARVTGPRGEVFQALEPGAAFGLRRSGRNPGGSSAFLLLDDLGLHVDGRRLEQRWRDTGVAIGRFWRALAAEHALQERGRLDQLARTREARGLGTMF